MNQLPADIDAYLARRIPEVLPAGAVALLRRASEIAESRGEQLYLVGGFVRDALLKIPDYDIDIAVVGDAPSLAQALAGETGSRVEVHEAFGTAVFYPGDGSFDLDIVTARREWYEQPGALPTVEAGTIADDMARRDFTANAMAVPFHPQSVGPLYDPHNGIGDMRAGLIRVLHSNSFNDDPTRMFRAVKLAKRLGWSVEVQTLELILRGVRDGVLATVSMQRISHELVLIMQEPRATAMLAELDRLGLLTNIHPLLRWPYAPDRQLISNPEQLTPEQRLDACLCILATEFSGAPEDAEEVARWLKLSAGWVRVMRDGAELSGRLESLSATEGTSSAIYGLLHDIDPRAIEAFTRIALFEGLAVRAHLTVYLNRLRYVKSILSGEYLRDLGVPPGPIYRRVLDALRDAKLDGLVREREDEERFVRQRLEEEGLQGEAQAKQ